MLYHQGLNIFLILILFLLAAWSSWLVYIDNKPFKEGSDRERVTTISRLSSDHPTYYPIGKDRVILNPEDTVHYKLYEADGRDQWDSQFHFGDGRLQIGPENRTYEIGMFHELRCLGEIRTAMAAQSPGPREDFLQECFNYLREMILCRADVTLEVILNAHHSVNHMYQHVCNDWTSLYAHVDDDALTWAAGYM